MEKAFVMLTASRVEAGPINYVAGALQQETRLYQGDQCVCVILCTFPQGSPEWEKWNAARTLDSIPTVRADSVRSDAPEEGARHGVAHFRLLGDHGPELER